MNEESLPRMEGNFDDLFGANSAQDEDPTLQQFSAESLQQINLPGFTIVQTAAQDWRSRHVDA